MEKSDKRKEANRERIALTKKIWENNNKHKRREYIKAYISNNKSPAKQRNRLDYWRKKQKELADQHLKNKHYNPSTIRFFPFSPTSVLCDVLAH